MSLIGFSVYYMRMRIFEERGINNTMFTGDFVMKVRCNMVNFMLGLSLSLGCFKGGYTLITLPRNVASA